MPNPLLDVATLKFRTYEPGMAGYYVHQWQFGGEARYAVVFLSEGRMHLTSCMQALVPDGEFAGPLL